MKRIFFSFLLSVFLVANFLLAIPVSAAGASFYISPATSSQIVGAKFTVAIKISTGGQSINAGQGSLTYDKTLLKAVAISKGNVFSLWTEEPSYSAGAGTIEFGGGVPQPGYSGNGGTICTITFQALKAGSAAVNFTSGYILANDGQGTNILSSMGQASFNITPKVAAPTADSTASKTTTAKTKTSTTPTPAPVETASYNLPEISSATHPDQTKWYKDRTIDFSWQLPAGAAGVSVAFDQTSNTDPGTVSSGLFNVKEYTVDRDGSWYVHVKIKDEKGRWGTAGHFRVNIDSASPKAFDLSVKQDDPNDWPMLYFQTSDDLSGLEKYQILIDSLSAQPIELGADQTSYKLANLSVGSHSVAVKAIDAAGNETLSNLAFEVSAAATPEIKNYSAQISEGDKFFISGTAGSSNSITIFIQGDNQSEPEAVATKSDSDGNWFNVSAKTYNKGRYTVWAQAANSNGIASKQSAKVSFSVKAPALSGIGSFLSNYFTVIVSLIFVIVLIAALLIWIFEFVRKRLKKETLEVEDVLEKNMEELKVSLSEEIDDLGKLTKTEFNKVRPQVKTRLNFRIDEANRHILKEIKDVEKIIK
jgi:hypothetical protein